MVVRFFHNLRDDNLLSYGFQISCFLSSCLKNIALGSSNVFSFKLTFFKKKLIVCLQEKLEKEVTKVEACQKTECVKKVLKSTFSVCVKITAFLAMALFLNSFALYTQLMCSKPFWVKLAKYSHFNSRNYMSYNSQMPISILQVFF